MTGELMLAVAETGDPIRVQLWSLLVGTVLPVLVGLVTRSSTSNGLKAILLAAFSAISGFATEVLESGDDFQMSTALITALGTFLVGVATHFGLWKPTGVSAKAQEVGNR